MENGRGKWAWKMGVENGRGKWAWKMGVENGRGKWAWKMGVENGRGKWAWKMGRGENGRGKWAWKMGVENGRGKWAWKMGVENGRGKWAWKMGVENGRGKWADSMCASTVVCLIKGPFILCLYLVGKYWFRGRYQPFLVFKKLLLHLVINVNDVLIISSGKVHVYGVRSIRGNGPTYRMFHLGV